MKVTIDFDDDRKAFVLVGEWGDCRVPERIPYAYLRRWKNPVKGLKWYIHMARLRSFAASRMV